MQPFKAIRLPGTPNGIVLYDGCYNCTVQNNTVTDSEGIMLRTIDQLPNATLYPESRRIHEVAISNQILNNTVSNTNRLSRIYRVRYRGIRYQLLRVWE